MTQSIPQTLSPTVQDIELGRLESGNSVCLNETEGTDANVTRLYHEKQGGTRLPQIKIWAETKVPCRTLCIGGSLLFLVFLIALPFILLYYLLASPFLLRDCIPERRIQNNPELVIDLKDAPESEEIEMLDV